MDRRTALAAFAAVPALALTPNLTFATFGEAKLVSPTYTWQEDLVKDIKVNINRRWKRRYRNFVFNYINKPYDYMITASVDCNIDDISNYTIAKMEYDFLFEMSEKFENRKKLEKNYTNVFVSNIYIYNDVCCTKMKKFSFYGWCDVWYC